MNDVSVTKGEMPDEWKDAGYLSKFDLSDYNAGKLFKAIRFNMYDIVQTMPFNKRVIDYSGILHTADDVDSWCNETYFVDTGRGSGTSGSPEDPLNDYDIIDGSYDVHNHIGTLGTSFTDYDTVVFGNGAVSKNYKVAYTYGNPQSNEESNQFTDKEGDYSFFNKYRDTILSGRSFFTSKVVNKVLANISVSETDGGDNINLSFFENGNKVNVLPFSGGVLEHSDILLDYVLEDIVINKAVNDSVKWASDGASFTYEKDGKTLVKDKRKGLQTGSIIYIKAGDFIYGISIIDLPLRYKTYDGKNKLVYDINNAKFVYKKFPLSTHRYLLDGIDKTKFADSGADNRIELKKDTIYAIPKKVFYNMYDSEISENGGHTRLADRFNYLDIIDYKDINTDNNTSNLLSGGYSIDDSDASSWYYKKEIVEPSRPIPVFPPVVPPPSLFSFGPLRAILFAQGTPKKVSYPTSDDVKYIDVKSMDGDNAVERFSVIDKSFDMGSGFDVDHNTGIFTCGGYFRMYLGYYEDEPDVDENVYFKLKNNKVRAFIDGNAGNFLFVLPEGDATPEEPKKPETPKNPETSVVIPSVPTESVTPVEPVITPVTPVSEDTPEPVVTTKPAVISKKVSIKGRIIYKGGVPFENYKVSLGGETIISDKNGDFSFADRDYGSYLLKSDLFKLKLDFSKDNKVTDVFVDKNTTVTKAINDKGVFINVVYNLEAPSDEVPVNPGRKVIPKKTPDTLPRTGGGDVSVYGFIMIALALLLIRKKK